MKYHFFYDETEHSRKINIATVSAPNYYDNFIAVILGWKEADEQVIRDSYLKFEKKYSAIMTCHDTLAWILSHLNAFWKTQI